MIQAFIATHRRPAESPSLQTLHECLFKELNIGTYGFALSRVQTSGILRIR